MAIETVEKEQAELKGQFDQFGKRVDRMQTDVDNTKSELILAINRLSDKMGHRIYRSSTGLGQHAKMAIVLRHCCRHCGLCCRWADT